MDEQQGHLASAIEQQRVIMSEIQQLERLIGQKRESLFKFQGIIEYLSGIGVTLPEPEPQEESVSEETEE